MRILFITSRSPFSPTRGDTLRAYHQMRVLARRHELTLVAPLGPGAPDAEAAEFPCEAVSVPWSRRRGVARLAWAPVTGFPLQVLYVYPPRTHTVVSRLLAGGRFDLAHVQLLRMAPVLDAITVPCVLDYQDAFSLNVRRRAEMARGPRSWALRCEAGRLRRYEQLVAGKAVFTTVTSAADREALGDPPNCVVIPNGVDVERFRFEPARPASNDIVFSGRMSYPPNADAAAWFAGCIFPRVRAAVPGARFLIVGADPPPRLRRLQGMDGVVVTGRVPSVADHLARAAVAVAPLRCATGIQNKALEAMAVGTPVVTTPAVARGIDATPGRHLLVGTTEEELAGHVRRLLEDRATAAAMASRARALVESQYTWEQTVAALEHVYDAASSAAWTPEPWALQPVPI